MTLLEMKKKVLALIEELNKDSELLTDDPDIQLKINHVINQVQVELARMKKITAYSTETVTANEVFELKDLDDFYQLRHLKATNDAGENVDFDVIEDMVTFKENGTATFFYYKYPKQITGETSDTYKFELSTDALEIMPYGVASDLLKSDVSAQYGAVYEKQYEKMLARLDPRFALSMVTIEGGVI